MKCAACIGTGWRNGVVGIDRYKPGEDWRCRVCAGYGRIRFNKGGTEPDDSEPKEWR